MSQPIFTSIVQIRARVLKALTSRLGQDNNLRRVIAKAVAGTFGARVANAFLGYALSLLLAHSLGAGGYGAYAYGLAWVTLLQIPALLGLGPLLTRELAVYQAQGAWGLARGLLRWSNGVIFVASVVLALLAAYLASVLTPATNLQTLTVFWIAMVSLPLMALERMRQASMQALNRIVVGQLPELVLRPFLLIVLLGGAYLLFGTVTPPLAMGIYVAVTGVTCLVGVQLLQSSLPSELRKATSEYQVWVWLRNALPMLLIGSMYVVNNQTDTVMLGALKDPAAVGIYTVANRGAGLITFILFAFNTALAPSFASLHAAGDKAKLQRVVTKSCRLILLAALPIAIGLIVFGRWFLLLFGSEFIQGNTTLTILCLGQIVNAFTGSIAILLTMTGYQNDTAIGVAISAVLNIILNATFIPIWGAEGAAAATAISKVVWNILLSISVYKRLKIYPTALGSFKKLGAER